MNQLIVVDFKLIRFSAASRSHLVYVRLYWVQTNAIPVVPWLYWRIWARLVRRLFDFHLDVRPGLFCGCPYALCPAPRQRVDWNVTVVTKSRLRVPRLNSNASIDRRTGEERWNDCVRVQCRRCCFSGCWLDQQRSSTCIRYWQPYRCQINHYEFSQGETSKIVVHDYRTAVTRLVFSQVFL